MIKTYCDICGSEEKVQEIETLVNALKARLGECGLYKTIYRNLEFYGKNHKPVKHICQSCGNKILNGVNKHYNDLFNSFFEEPIPITKTVNVTVNQDADIEKLGRIIWKQLNESLKGYGCKY